MATSPTAPRSLPAPATATTAFHLAAHLGTWGRREDFIRDNVAGTENALAACREAGVARFVHCSTEAALIAGRPLLRWSTRPRRCAPIRRLCTRSTKALAERAVHAAAARGFGTVVLRPRFVWGRGDTTLLPSITAMVERGKFAWIGGGRQLTDTTHVDNVVEGLLAGAAHGRPGEAYFVTDGDRVVFRDFVSALLETQGVEPPSRSVPAWLAGGAAVAGEAAWKLLPLGGEPPLTRFAVWVSSQECTIDISKARSELSYEPPKSRAAGLAELRADGDAPAP